MGNKKNKRAIKNKMTALFFIIVIVMALISAYNLIPLGTIGFLIFLGESIGFIIILILWHSCTYGYICRVCNKEFNVGFIRKLISKNDVSCPICHKKDIVKESFMEIDIDED